MRRIVWVLVILASLVTIISLEQINVSDTLSGLENRIQTISTKIESLEQVSNISEDVDELSDFWDKRESIICLTYNHKDMEKIGEQIKKLQTYVKLNDKNNSILEFNLLAFHITGYEHLVVTSFQNVL